MSVEALLEDLRDIHLPPATDPLDTPLLVWWPFLILGGLIALIALVSWWRRGAPLRALTARLRQLEANGGSTQDLTQLATEIAAVTKAGPLPDGLFRAPGSLGGDDRDALLAFLRQALRRRP